MLINMQFIIMRGVHNASNDGGGKSSIFVPLRLCIYATRWTAREWAQICINCGQI